MQLVIYSIFVLGLTSLDARKISFTNKCSERIWISPLTNDKGPQLKEGILSLAGGGGSGQYNIPDGGWGGRFWPKQGCDGNGQNCNVGQSIAPCLPTGCDPPAETKVEFHFPSTSEGGAVWYDVSLVDGYSLPVKIIPDQIQGTCVKTQCALSLDACPTNENEVGDLRVIKNGKTVQCLSPCKKWNYPAPFGLGRSELTAPGVWLCCPTPPIDPTPCRTNIVVKTKYVDLIHKACPSAYSYSYDDEAGLHDCPLQTSFAVTFCP